MLSETVVIEGEVSLVSQIDGDPSLLSAVDGDPDVVIAEGMSPTYPHYSGSYTVTPSGSVQVLDTSDKVMDDDVTVQAVPQGSATTPATIITANPTISVSSGGLITATVSKTQQITPTVVEGYVSAGTPGNVGVSGSNTEQLSVQGAQTIYPSSSDQEIASGKFLTGKQTFKKVVVSGLSADKVLQGTTVKIGDVDDDDRIANVVGTAQQGITPTGTKNITANGTNIDVYNYQYADVAVPNSYSASDEGKVVSNGALVAQTSDTVTTNDTYDTTLINSLTVNVSGGSLPSSVLDHVTIVPTADITNSNKLTLNFHATDRYYLIGYCADDLTPPDSGTIFANGRRLKGINGSTPTNSNAGQLLRADGTTGSDNSWCSYNESTGEIKFPNSTYSVLKSGKTYEIWLFALGDNANA